jgi:hypothetical protein
MPHGAPSRPGSNSDSEGVDSLRMIPARGGKPFVGCLQEDRRPNCHRRFEVGRIFFWQDRGRCWRRRRNFLQIGRCRECRIPQFADSLRVVINSTFLARPELASRLASNNRSRVNAGPGPRLVGCGVTPASRPDRYGGRPGGNVSNVGIIAIAILGWIGGTFVGIALADLAIRILRRYFRRHRGRE